MIEKEDRDVVSLLRFARCRCGSIVIDVGSRPVARICSRCRAAHVYQTIVQRGATKMSDLAAEMLAPMPATSTRSGSGGD